MHCKNFVSSVNKLYDRLPLQETLAVQALPEVLANGLNSEARRDSISAYHQRAGAREDHELRQPPQSLKTWQRHWSRGLEASRCAPHFHPPLSEENRSEQGPHLLRTNIALLKQLLQESFE